MSPRALTTALVSLAAVWSQAFTFTIVHVNDTHSRVEPVVVSGNSYGGLARIATLFGQLRKSETNPVFLHAGDAFQGTIYYNVYKGLADGHLMNLIGFDAMAIGNHEFDDGPEGFLPFTRQVSFPIVSSNLDFSAIPELARRVTPHTVLKIGKERVGVIGTMTPELPSISAPGAVKMLDLDASLKASLDALEKQGINKIIVLSHCGYAEDQEMALKHPRIDVIVGGHSHSYLGDPGPEGFPNPIGAYPTVVGTTQIVQAWEWGKIVGRLKVTFDRKGKVTKTEGRTIVVNQNIPGDPKIASAILAFQKPLEALKTTVIAQAPGLIARNGAQGSPESPMGSLIADAQVAATKGQNTLFALMNPGGVRASIEPGPITYDEVVAVQPFGNTLVVMDLTGKEVKATLESGLANDRILQVSSGFTYVVDMRKPSGSRLVEAKLNGEPIQDDRTYRVVVNNFMARGGDSLLPLADAKGYRYDTGIIDLDALLNYLKANTPVQLSSEKRITRAQP